jgi:hypothetical protein
VLILLSVVLLLVGGGLGPPVLGLILAVAALGMHSVPRRASRRSLLPLAPAWPSILAVGVVGYLALFPSIRTPVFTSLESPAKPWSTRS